MDNLANNLEGIVEEMMTHLDLEKSLAQTQGINILMQKLAPQEMDRLVNVLYMGVRHGLAEIINKQIGDANKQLETLRSEVIKELRKATEDRDMVDLEKQFNPADFCARIYQDLPR